MIALNSPVTRRDVLAVVAVILVGYGIQGYASYYANKQLNAFATYLQNAMSKQESAPSQPDPAWGMGSTK